MKFKEEIIKVVRNETGQKDIALEVPPDSSFGDYAFPCFSLANVLKKSPNEIAKELAGKLKINCVEKIEAKGPYVNFFLNKARFIKEILSRIERENMRYGSTNLGNGKKALIEHTSINPNASPHVGRARNAIIGDSIARLLKFQNYKVEVHYFVNDVGKQIAMLVLACRKKKNIRFNDLLKMYIDINKKIEENKELEKDVFNLLHQLENGDKEVKKAFKEVVKICIEGQTKILSELGIRYDKFDYESDYLWNKKTEQILKELEKTGKLFTDEEGRKVLDQSEFKLAMKSPVLVLTRSDGTSLYPLRDIAYTIDKHVEGENIIVLGEDQKLYFEQIRAALKILKKEAPRVVHYAFVLLKEGKMSTRRGNLVLLEDFMKEALEKAKKEIEKRHGSVDEKIAKAIAYSAIKFSIIRVGADKNVIFSWDQALNFEGDSGPYIQYAYARICSIIRKYGKDINEDINFNLLRNNKEFELVKLLSEFPFIVEESTKQLKPHHIANYLLELAKTFNEFYHSCPVLQEKEKLRNARLFLIKCVKRVLKNGMNLLGMEEIEKM